LISSVGRAGKRAIGQAAGGFKQGASDDAMASYYDVQAKQDEFNQMDAEAQIDNGYFNSRGGVGENPAAKTGMGAGMGLGGDLSYKSQKLNDINTKLSTPHETSADNVHVADITNQPPSDEQAKRAQDLRAAQVASILGKNAPVKDNVADKFATIDNFESQEFANKLSNAKKAQLYRERAKHARTQGVKSSLATAGGAVAGGITAFAATAYMDSGTSAMITSAGIDLGASAGGVVSSIENMKRLSKDAKKDRTVFGEGSELGYAIKTAEDGAHLYTYSRFNDKEPETWEASVDMTDLPAVHKSSKEEGKGEMVTTEGWYETNGERIIDAHEGEQFRPANDKSSSRLAIEQGSAIALSEEVEIINGNISNESVNNGNNIVDGAIHASVNVRKKEFNEARESLAQYCGNHEDVFESLKTSFGEGVRELHLNNEVYSKGDSNFEEAEKISRDMHANANITVEEKAQGIIGLNN